MDDETCILSSITNALIEESVNIIRPMVLDLQWLLHYPLGNRNNYATDREYLLAYLFIYFKRILKVNTMHCVISPHSSSSR